MLGLFLALNSWASLAQRAEIHPGQDIGHVAKMGVRSREQQVKALLQRESVVVPLP